MDEVLPQKQCYRDCAESCYYGSTFSQDAETSLKAASVVSVTQVRRYLRLGYLAHFGVQWTWLDKLHGLQSELDANGDRHISFNYHPIFMNMAYIVFMSEALLQYRVSDITAYSDSANSQSARIWQAVLTVLCGICSLVGLVFTVLYHVSYEDGHLYSLHSWMGICALIVLGSQTAISADVLFDRIEVYLPEKVQRLLKRVLHTEDDVSKRRNVNFRTLGGSEYKTYVYLLAYLGGMVSILTGLQRKQGLIQCEETYCAERVLPNVLVLLTVFCAILTSAAYVSPDYDGSLARLADELIVSVTNADKSASKPSHSWQAQF
ncbi:hypothetical protein CYMTET_48158 [Cymbomonas tetramitiformis]|uniref:Cytochrome b561 domain-containing protein n=1 Tax=Cymbomonas tetramitiformis TaxID=36881 RepID=A0AAE0BSV0_9CHLO|nr:hypothetical protein CYMTET_48158 [Cymbomonas tetramitiformis]